MAMNQASLKYRENSIFTASPEELTLMLYNGLLRFIMHAERAMAAKDLEKTNFYILKAQDILNEFIATLDMQYEISHNLVLLYDYMLRRLIEANVKKSPEILAEMKKMAQELRDTWEQAMKLARQQSS